MSTVNASPTAVHGRFGVLSYIVGGREGIHAP